MNEQRSPQRDDDANADDPPKTDGSSKTSANGSPSNGSRKPDGVNGAPANGSSNVNAPGLELPGGVHAASSHPAESLASGPVGEPTFGDVQPGPVCGVCPLFHTCVATCEPVNALIPSMERGRIDPEDLPKLHMGVRLTNAILDHEHILTPRQREVIRLYYREALQQNEIATRLGITQQAVNDGLKRARLAVGRYVRKLQTDAMAASQEDDVLARMLTDDAGGEISSPRGSDSHSSNSNRSTRGS